MTNTMTDVQDLFVERVTRDAAEFRGQLEPLRVTREVIRVKDAPDIVLRVRGTRHGPIVSDVLDDAPGALALRWTALDETDGTMVALRRVARAANWDEFVASLAGFKTAMQNFVYADVDGNIGYYAPGAVPIRASGDGRRPVPGWSGEFEWIGYVPYDELPRAFNPARGAVVSANNQVVPDGYPHVISTSWDPGHRAARILELLDSRDAHTVEHMEAMQADVRSHHARTILPLLAAAEARGDRSRAALERLRVWDGSSAASSPEAAIYRAWWRRLGERMFQDELGAEGWRAYERFAFSRAKAIENILAGGDQSWCDDVTTTGVESCGQIAGLALSEALESLARPQGSPDVREWQLGRVHRVAFPHLPFDGVTWLRPVFSRSRPAGGDPFTVNPVMIVRDRTFVSSYRQIIDLAALDNSRFVIPMGQSGQVFSGRYDNLLDAWHGGRYIPMRFSQAAIQRGVGSVREIVPR
jgi:penicillin amidase